MSKEFQKIKERNDVKKQLNDFIANSLPRAVSNYFQLFFFLLMSLFNRLRILIVLWNYVQHVFIQNLFKLMRFVLNGLI